jgi:hypothetical protein
MRTATPPISLPGFRPEASSLTRAGARVVPWLAPALVFGLIAWRRWSLFGPYVTGMDPGEWFALGRGYLGGEGRSTEGAYPPLIPVIFHLLRQVAEPMVVAKLVAVLSVVVIAAAAYLVAREGMDRWFALGITATIALSGVFTESIAFGGSPQNAALMFMILAGLALARYLAAGARRDAVWAGAALSGAALSHHTYFPVACLVFAAVWGAWLTTRPDRAAIRSRTIGTIAAGAVAVLVFLPIALDFQSSDYDAPVNSNRFDYTDAIGISIREARWLWWPVFIVGTLAFPLLLRRRTNAAWQVGAALTGVAAVLFLFTTEPRLLPPLIVGTALGVGLLLQAAWERTGSTALGAAPLVVAAAMPILLWPFADLRAEELYRHYRVMDRSLMGAIEFVDAYEPEGAVLVRKTQKGWPGGWWFEGLTDETIKVGSEERWLGFGQERRNARLADRVFDRAQTGEQAVAAARRGDVQLLVFRKGDWRGWQTWLVQPSGLRVVYDDGVTMVLDVGTG